MVLSLPALKLWLAPGIVINVAVESDAQTFSSTVLGSAILQNLQSDFTVTKALLQSETNIWILKNIIKSAF